MCDKSLAVISPMAAYDAWKTTPPQEKQPASGTEVSFKKEFSKTCYRDGPHEVSYSWSGFISAAYSREKRVWEIEYLSCREFVVSVDGHEFQVSLDSHTEDELGFFAGITEDSIQESAHEEWVERLGVHG